MSYNTPSNVTSNSVQIVAKQKKNYLKIWIAMSNLYFWMKRALSYILQIACIVFNVYKSIDSFCKHIFPLINMYKTISPGADVVGVCSGAHPPPPPPEMTYAFLIQLVYCKIGRYVWFVFSAVHIILLGTLSNDDDDNVKKKNWFYEQNCSARASFFLVHFFDVYCTTTTRNLPMRRPVEDVDILRQIFPSLFEHG